MSDQFVYLIGALGCAFTAIRCVQIFFSHVKERERVYAFVDLLAATGWFCGAILLVERLVR